MKYVRHDLDRNPHDKHAAEWAVVCKACSCRPVFGYGDIGPNDFDRYVTCKRFEYVNRIGDTPWYVWIGSCGGCGAVSVAGNPFTVTQVIAMLKWKLRCNDVEIDHPKHVRLGQEGRAPDGDRG